MAASRPNDLDRLLRLYLNNRLQVSNDNARVAKDDVTRVVERVVEMVKNFDSKFDMEINYRGSVYEKVKIKEADEFDFDLTIKSLQVESVQVRRPQGIPSGRSILFAFQTNSEGSRAVCRTSG